MKPHYESFACIVLFPSFTSALPLPYENVTRSFDWLQLFYPSRTISTFNELDSRREDAGLGPPEIFDGSPTVTTVCPQAAIYRGWSLVGASVGLTLLLALIGLLASLALGVLSFDLPRLTVWSRIGDMRRRYE